MLCPLAVLYSMQFVLEYALWRGLDQLIVYNSFLDKDCQTAVTLRFLKCLSLNGVSSDVGKPGQRQRVPQHRLSLVIFTPPDTNNNDTSSLLEALLRQLTDDDLHSEHYEWLIVAKSQKEQQLISTVFRKIPLRYDGYTIVAYPERQNYELTDDILCKGKFNYAPKSIVYKGKRRSRPQSSCRFQNSLNRYRCEQEAKMESTSRVVSEWQKYKNLTRYMSYKSGDEWKPLLKSGLIPKNSRTVFDMVAVNNSTNADGNVTSNEIPKPDTEEGSIEYVKNGKAIFHHFRISVVQYVKVRQNSTVYGSFLGTWQSAVSTWNVSAPWSVERRSFMGEQLRVGQLNASADHGALHHLRDHLLSDLQASASVRQYEVMGDAREAGSLLGALRADQLDAALELVPAQPHIVLPFPIASSMRNIYLHPAETSTARDLFLAPFSPALLGSVAGTALALAAGMALAARRRFALGDALLWSAGVLCQQGASWIPRSHAASIILITSLMFGIVIYNAYAAFITSVLSVQVPAVESVQDILNSPDYRIGYIRNGLDQQYLMETKDAKLNALYIRGYSDTRQLSADAPAGLRRAAAGRYAFFAARGEARRALAGLGGARCRVVELPLPATAAHVAFPVRAGSPYAKALLVSLLRGREQGAVARASAALLPSMPRCAPPPAFASARLRDVRTAFALAVLGLGAALVIVVGECLWTKRRNIKEYLVRVYGSKSNSSSNESAAGGAGAGDRPTRTTRWALPPVGARCIASEQHLGSRKFMH